ncbi:MAG: hypothetical protein JXR96_24315 [Deltaproteobacteria bacterium]|nr:hypothetical protein [Deltaproteobacteria bacterium]
MSAEFSRWAPVSALRDEGRQVRAQISIPADCPWLEGHFPARPILPGVALLASVESILRRVRPGRPVLRIRHVRFRRVVGPGDELDVEIEIRSLGEDLRARFRISDASGQVGKGTFHLGPA